ncbi:MAG: uroporphyrinogen-III C-methyltransferase [Brooklawnia sp.]|jgi:uroporphyrin-III C-methyltransferase
MTELTSGSVTLVGGGPGDPDLITVAGLRAVQLADVILFDRLAPQALLAEASPEAELVDVGKIPRGQQTPQEEINALLVSHARAGKKVLRLKGGDSYLFGRGGEEALACTEAGIPVQVIPGVSSAIAAPALAGIPVTHRGLSQGVTIVSGHVPPGDSRSDLDWAAMAQTGTTLVILMGVKYLPQIVAALLGARMAPQTAAAIVVNAGSPQMRVLRAPLDRIAEVAQAEGVEPPAITIIGAVAGLDLG